jgi:hypothetical protein
VPSKIGSICYKNENMRSNQLIRQLCVLCVIFFTGLPYFSSYMIPKPEKMYQTDTKWTKWSQNIPNVYKILQIAIEYINIFQSKALLNLPKLGFLV